MARIRTVKPEFYAHERLSELPPEWHLLAAAILNYADDYGYFNANPALVLAGTMPLRPTVNVVAALEALVAIGYARLGRGPDGRRYGQVVNFAKHQRVERPSKRTVVDGIEVAWDDGSPNPHRPIGEGSVNPHRGLSGGSPLEQGTGNREPGTGIVEPGAGNARATAIATDPQHDKHVDGFCTFVCLPQRVFDDFVNRVVHAGADHAVAPSQVRAWAQDVRARWQGRIPGADIFDFWRNEWQTTHGSNTPAKGRDLTAGLRNL